ncbi:MAG TPA: GNAT family N-acetyltransferase [Thermoanaerobaculia bacterium]|nr:GNAT family N-acetyltransferase [Thermoanaerobaculia bacterium]
MTPGGNPAFPLATPGDEDLLVELMREFYVIEHLPFDERVVRKGLREILGHRAYGLIHLIQVDGHPVGYMVLTFGFSLEFHGRDALIDELYVQEEHRGRGLGRVALELAEEVCRREGIAALHLEVDRVNVRAQEVYRKAGYRDHDRYLLTKWLDGSAQPSAAPQDPGTALKSCTSIVKELERRIGHASQPSSPSHQHTTTLIALTTASTSL